MEHSLLPDAICTYLPTATAETFQLTLWTVAIASFFGGFAHCAFMCGPFVIMQVSHRLEDVSARDMTELTRLKGAALIPYHLGRLTTYMLLGAVAGLIGGFSSDIWRHSAAIFMFVAGLGMIFSIFPTKHLKIVPNWVRDISATLLIKKVFLDKIGSLFTSPIRWKGYLLGIILGFLPCGMVYAALALAASTASFTRGALVMSVFGLATIPGLFATALAGTLAATALKKHLSFFAQSATVTVGAWLCLASLRILGL